MSDSNDNLRTSFDTLVRPHVDRLYRFAYRLCGDKAEAEDLFQDVLAKVYGRIADLADVSEPAAWLCRVMYNHFIDNRRRYARQRLATVSEGSLPEQSVEAFAGDLDPVADKERLDNIMKLDKALARLSDEHRLVVMLHDCEGYKLKEIQEITGDPVGTLKSRLHRARGRLKEFLTNDGTFSPSQACNG